jgi:hypothetical protein
VWNEGAALKDSWIAWAYGLWALVLDLTQGMERVKILSHQFWVVGDGVAGIGVGAAA